MTYSKSSKRQRGLTQNPARERDRGVYLHEEYLLLPVCIYVYIYIYMYERERVIVWE